MAPQRLLRWAAGGSSGQRSPDRLSSEDYGSTSSAPLPRIPPAALHSARLAPHRVASHRDSLQLPDLEEPTVEEAVLEAVETLGGMGDRSFHVVHAGEGPQPQPYVLARAAATEFSRSATEPASAHSGRALCPPDGTTAVLVLLASGHACEATTEFLEQLRTLPERPPTIVLLLRPPNAPRDPVAEAAATQALLSFAGDVIVQPDTTLELVALLAASLERTVWCRRACARFEVLLRQQRRENQTLLWHAIDRLLEGFPVLDSNLPTQLAPQQQYGHWLLQEPLGRGGFGEVWSAVGEGGEGEALKFVPKGGLRSDEEIQALWLECCVLSNLRHPNVVKFYGVLHGPRHVCIRMELAGPLHLANAIRKEESGRLCPERARELFGQLAAALDYCHAEGIAHCDLKPENIVCSQGPLGEVVKLVDFGLAVEVGAKRKEAVGSMPFAAPEVLLERSYRVAPADVWSLAIILLEMLGGVNALPKILEWSGPLAPNSSTATAIKAAVGATEAFMARIVRHLAWTLPSCLRLLFTGMLDTVPDKRFSARDVAIAPWTQSV